MCKLCLFIYVYQRYLFPNFKHTNLCFQNHEPLPLTLSDCIQLPKQTHWKRKIRCKIMCWSSAPIIHNPVFDLQQKWECKLPSELQPLLIITNFNAKLRVQDPTLILVSFQNCVYIHMHFISKTECKTSSLPLYSKYAITVITHYFS